MRRKAGISYGMIQFSINRLGIWVDVVDAVRISRVSFDYISIIRTKY